MKKNVFMKLKRSIVGAVRIFPSKIHLNVYNDDKNRRAFNVNMTTSIIFLHLRASSKPNVEEIQAFLQKPLQTFALKTIQGVYMAVYVKALCQNISFFLLFVI